MYRQRCAGGELNGFCDYLREAAAALWDAAGYLTAAVDAEEAARPCCGDSRNGHGGGAGAGGKPHGHAQTPGRNGAD